MEGGGAEGWWGCPGSGPTGGDLLCPARPLRLALPRILNTLIRTSYKARTDGDRVWSDLTPVEPCTDGAPTPCGRKPHRGRSPT